MVRQLLAVLACFAAFGLVFDTAGCGPTCKAGEASCSTNNGSSGDSGADSSKPSTCPALTALRSCMDAFCKTADNPFCTCWKRGYQINISDCPQCVPFDTAQYCADAAHSDPASLDCSASADAVKSLCVGVQ